MESSEKSTKQLKDELQVLQKQTSDCFPLMRGSVVYTGMKDKAAKYSLRMNNKTKFMYLGKSKEHIAKEYITNYKKFLDIVEKMTLINMEIIRRIPTRKR
jgi:hypothetical protein